MKQFIIKYKSLILLSILFVVLFSLVLVFTLGNTSNVANASYVRYSFSRNNLIDGAFTSSFEVPVLENELTLNKWCVLDGSVSSLTVDSYGLNINSVTAGTRLLFGVDSSSLPDNVCCSIGCRYSSTNITFISYNYNVANGYSNVVAGGSYQNSTYYDYAYKLSGITGLSGFGVTFSSGGSYSIYFLKVESGSTYTGQPTDSYTPNGYDAGFTDGVNSVEVPDVSGVVDLTNISWQAPSTASVYNVSATYHVNGTIYSNYYNDTLTFDALYTASGNSIFGEYNSEYETYFSPLYFYTNYGTSLGEPVMANDLITFTGGTDVTNSDLISWLQSNSAFLSYSDGYQDGYDVGYNAGESAGYQDGFADSFTTLDTNLRGFGDSAFTGVTGQEITNFWWSIPNYFTPNGWGYLYINYNNLPVGSYITWNFPYLEYALQDTSDNITTYSKVDCKFEFGYYNNLLTAPSDSAKSFRLDPDVDTYSFTVDRAGDTLVIYFPTNLLGATSDQRTFRLSWSGDENHYSFVTSTIGIELQVQLENAYNEGVAAGTNVGKTEGYAIGYNEALSQYEGATFSSLIGAVFDAPITAIIGKYENGQRVGGLLNFEILGVNLSAFVMALISIGIVLFVLRVFMRGL